MPFIVLRKLIYEQATELTELQMMQRERYV